MDSALNQPHRDPWGQTIRLLGWVSTPTSGRVVISTLASPQRSARYAQSSPRKPFASWVGVNVVERLSDVTAAVTWHDPTLCNYESQIWREGIARFPGLCALTGADILPGDSIYRPIGQPANAGAMIHAAAIGRVLDAIDVADPIHACGR